MQRYSPFFLFVTILIVIAGILYGIIGHRSVDVSYTPPVPFSFVIFSVGTDGVSVQATKSLTPEKLVTEIGTFAVNLALSSSNAPSLEPNPDELLLTIRHIEHGTLVDTIFEIRTGGQEVVVTANGHVTIHIANRRVFIDASKSDIQTIEVSGLHATVVALTSRTSTLLPTAKPTPNATAIYYAENPNPYPPKTGRLVLNDPLRANKDNGTGNGWQGSDIAGALCYFENGAYHAREDQPPYGAAITECTMYPIDTYYRNFAFEAQMRIVNGNCGGLVFRESDNAYRFVVCRDQSYFLDLYDQTAHEAPFRTDLRLVSGTSSTIQDEPGQTNTLAVVANGSILDLYMNRQKIARFDTAPNSDKSEEGKIGFIAEYTDTPTDVAFTNVKVWQF